jgi:hypothetical protein
MPTSSTSRPAFGQPGWRRRQADRYGWDKEFAAIGAILVLVLLSVSLVRADDNALPQDDPKNAAPAPQEIPHCYTDQYFLPLPSWSRFTRMPALPEQLQPQGGGEIKHKPAPVAVAETKPDLPPMPKKLPPAPAPADRPEVEAISPFLQWVHDHPQEAAAQARSDAAVYHAAPTTAGPVVADPYWMPPMIDQSQAGGGNGSAAIYSTPQK